MGCNSSTAVSVVDQNKPIKNRKNRPATPGPKSIAFEVQLDKPDSFKMKLPKRLQRLEELANSNNSITAEEIAERQKLAERRRKSAIEGKVLKSKQFQAKILAANNRKTNSPNNNKTNSPGNNKSNNKSNNLKNNKNNRTSSIATAKM